jgi:thiol-disulfide isomerase/thioredoxin
MKQNIAIIVGLALIIGLVTFYYQQRPPAQSDAGADDKGAVQWQTEGQLTPDAPLQFLDGSRTNLRAYAGKPMLIHFWATWCKPCLAEWPLLLELAESRPELQIIAISLDQGEAEVQSYQHHAVKRAGLKALPDNFRIALDPDQVLAGEIFQTVQVPETILVNTHLRMVDKVIGAKEDWLSAEMSKTLDGLNAPVSGAEQ